MSLLKTSLFSAPKETKKWGVRRFPLLLIVLNFFVSSCTGIIYQPGSKSSGDPFSSDISFSEISNSIFSFDASKIEMSSGTVHLIPTGQIDNSSGAFSQGSLSGSAEFDSSNGYLRLGSAASNLEFDPSWTPAWSNIIGYWKFNEADWTTANQNDAVVLNSITGTMGVAKGSANTVANGMFGRGATFNGSTDYVTIANPFTVVPNDTISISFWVKPNFSASGGFGRVIQFSDGSKGWTIQKVSPGTLNIRMDTSAGANQTLGDFKVVDLVWSHILVTIDTGKVNVFVNGQQVDRDSTYIHGTGFAVTGPLNFASNGTNFFAGQLDEVAIWNMALSPVAARTIYEHQASKFSGTLTSRVLDTSTTGQSWSSFSWTPTLPFLKELPDAAVSEQKTNYTSLYSDTLMNGIQGLWHLDEAAGTSGAGSIKESSGQSPSLNGTPSGGVTFGVSGKFNNAASFNGTTGIISIPDSPGQRFLIPDGASMAAWVYLSALPNKWAGIVVKSRPAGRFWGLYIENINNKWIAAAMGDNIYGPTAKLGWTHLAVVQKGNIGRDFYVDGKLVNSGLAVQVDGVQPLTIGTANYATEWFPGVVDEVAIWKRTLDPAEVVQLYRRGANRIAHQVRTCSDASCSTNPSWLGPDGTNQSYFSELYNTPDNSLTGAVAATLPTLMFAHFGALLTSPLGTGRYHQYRSILESDDANTLCDYGSGAESCSPELKSTISGAWQYDSNAPSISLNTGIPFTSIDSLTETLGTNGCDGIPGYTFSIDKSHWYYWNSSQWVLSDASYIQSSPATQLTSEVLQKFSAQVGTGALYFKVMLKSDGNHPCEISKISISAKK